MLKNLRSVFSSFKARALKAASVGGVVGVSTAAASLSVFAADPVEIGITTEQVEVILDYIVQNIAVIMPVGISVMGIMIGIGLIPTIIKKFTHA